MMKKLFLALFLGILTNCSNYGQLKVISSLPTKLEEASGVEKTSNSSLLWMHNDSGNKNELYGVNENGKIKKTITINAKNKDWEDITSDNFGNLFIADFGNNANKRKDLVILKINHEDLVNNASISAEKIKFSYPNQHKYPPKKEKLFFDAESLFYKNGFLYIFTKSRVKNRYGKTNLYKIPAVPGDHTAEYIGSFNNCNTKGCWITAATISDDYKKIALLTHHKVLVFSNFTSDAFFDGLLTEYNLDHSSQKEGIDFKDNNTLYITDEKANGNGGKLYTLSLK